MNSEANMTLLVIVIFIVWFLGSIVAWTIINGISPMPSSSKAKKKLQEILPNIDGPVYELGSGWGTLARILAKTYPHQHVIGYETSFFPYWISRLLYNRNNLVFYRKNFFEVDLSQAALIVCYLYPGAMRQLKEKFIKELKPGTVIISNTFAIPGWTPKQVWEVNDLYKTKIYRYEYDDRQTT